MKLKGKGGLIECPNCKNSDISLNENDAVDCDTEIHRIDCNNCGKHFVETWKAESWEEVD